MMRVIPCKLRVSRTHGGDELADFVGLSRHLLAPGGRWLAMKGIWPHDEISRLPGDVALLEVRRLHVPGVDGERHLVMIESTGGGATKAGSGES